MTDTPLSVARADIVAMMTRAADQGESERAARYQKMLERLDEKIDRQTRTTGKTEGGPVCA